MALLRCLVVLACSALSHAWQGAGLPARTSQRSASSAVTMKHHEYFQRLQRAEAGRLRLCVFRYVRATSRARSARSPGGSYLAWPVCCASRLVTVLRWLACGSL